ncbi:Hypothetical_protein [Hexamita inflata]|uniref:Hypothetical_protein n=1 Tax=Hexamita inflata TaxID=28002 RepID=A0AA86PUA5_9EUKA|nr:Hypothetical protein HINF_LOCUS32591 [Hexamita inflata]
MRCWNDKLSKKLFIAKYLNKQTKKQLSMFVITILASCWKRYIEYFQKLDKQRELEKIQEFQFQIANYSEFKGSQNMTEEMTALQILQDHMYASIKCFGYLK